MMLLKVVLLVLLGLLMVMILLVWIWVLILLNSVCWLKVLVILLILMIIGDEGLVFVLVVIGGVQQVGFVVSRWCVQVCCGWVSSVLVGLCFIRCLLSIIVSLLFSVCVNYILWVMYSRFMFCCCVVCSKVSILLCWLVLSFLVGLLMINKGVLVVCVVRKVMCWVMLFEIMKGYLLVVFVSFRLVNVCVVKVCVFLCVVCRFLFCVLVVGWLISLQVLVIWCVIVMVGFSVSQGFCGRSVMC